MSLHFNNSTQNCYTYSMSCVTCLCTVTSSHKWLNMAFWTRKLKEDMSRSVIHQSCLLLLIWSANTHIHEALTGFSTRQHPCIATQEEQKGSSSEWETFITELRDQTDFCSTFICTFYKVHPCLQLQRLPSSSFISCVQLLYYQKNVSQEEWGHNRMLSNKYK